MHILHIFCASRYSLPLTPCSIVPHAYMQLFLKEAYSSRLLCVNSVSPPVLVAWNNARRTMAARGETLRGVHYGGIYNKYGYLNSLSMNRKFYICKSTLSSKIQMMLPCRDETQLDVKRMVHYCGVR